MKISETGLEGAFVVDLDVHPDARGSFTELLPAGLLSDLPDFRPSRVVQINASRSGKGVLRGLHAVKRLPGQAKYVTCLAGAIHDVIVDVRAESRTFGRHFAIELSGSPTRQALFVPPGFAHGFLSLEPDTIVVYATSGPYDPSAEFAICATDFALGITWPSTGAVLRSQKDLNAPSLSWIASNRTGLLRIADDTESHEPR